MAVVSLPGPASWKEWARAGVVQAFIIAFYAEMYGFPLTIYFLARFFGLDLAWTEGGNLWAQVFGTPVAHLVAMVIGYAIVFSGATLVADGWRRVHRARRDGRLATEGAYARVRHPQYTGLFLIADEGHDAERVRQEVADWYDEINPDGFSGRACFDGGCGRAFADDGCGGMDRNHPIF